MIFEDYCTFETSMLLKEKGFDEYCEMFFCNPCEGYLRNRKIDEWRNSRLRKDMTCTCPTLQMAMKWLREVHNINIELNWEKGNQLYSFQIWKPGKFQPEISSLDLWRIYKDYNYPGEWNYEEACEIAIKYCLNNVI